MIRRLLLALTARLPVKVIRGPEGEPFLERYHIVGWPSGAGLVIHHFVGSDPDRGYHDHPWGWGRSLVLAGGYLERTPNRPERWFGAGSLVRFDGWDFHRVMLPEGGDAWTLFVHGRRVKPWGFLPEGTYAPYTTEVRDLDGGWWHDAPTGEEVRRAA